MNFKQTFNQLFPAFDSNHQKELVIRKTLAKPQNNISVLNTHRLDFNNVGDFYCAPHLYFDELKDKSLDISHFRNKNRKKVNNWIEKISDNSLIIGGGGLLNIRHFEKQMKLFEALALKGKKTVIWGAGHNDPNYKTIHNSKIKSYNVNINNFGLVGTRDYKLAKNWVPCVSCLNPIFDRNFNENQEIGILLGKKSGKKSKLLKDLSDYPLSYNSTNLEEMVNFIGKTNTLVTDSYHAMYWSILLGKKVLVVPTTSKFFDFKYQPVITSFENFKKDLNKAQSYSGILEECREINIDFSKKVFDYLNL